MGITIGTNLTIMHEKFSSEHQEYIILVNTITGERIKITME